MIKFYKASWIENGKAQFKCFNSDDRRKASSLARTKSKQGFDAWVSECHGYYNMASDEYFVSESVFLRDYPKSRV